jgi:phosphopantetheinyl transferase (holo-ACP synthase)
MKRFTNPTRRALNSLYSNLRSLAENFHAKEISDKASLLEQMPGISHAKTKFNVQKQKPKLKKQSSESDDGSGTGDGLQYLAKQG